MSDPRADPQLPAPWRAAFSAIDRGMFVPEFYRPHPDRAGWQRLTAPDPAWRAGVDSPDALVTQVGGHNHHPDDDIRGPATSSSSAPALMTAMLDALDIQHGHRVLEVGTGTGYNTALLCHRLGEDNVTTIDIDPALVHTATRRLAHIGYHPHTHVADALDGHPDDGPYDRILATVALPDIPHAWRGQLAPDGAILMPLDRHGTGGLLALFRPDPDDTNVLHGRLLDTRGYFMPLRANDFDPAAVLPDAAHDQPTQLTELPVEELIGLGGPAEHVIALLAGGFGHITFTPHDTGQPETWLTRPDRSWARITTDQRGRHHVAQGGPTSIWDAVDDAYRRWVALGHPTSSVVDLRSSVHGLTIKVAHE